MIECLDIWKSIGPDGLSTHFLREVACEIAETLTKLFNGSLQTGITLIDWKRNNATTVYTV